MNWYVFSRMLGMLSILVGGSMAFSLPWAFPIFGQAESFESHGFWGMAGAMAVSLIIGVTLYRIGRKGEVVILRKESLAIVGVGWMLVGVLGALPYLFSGAYRAEGVQMTIADALFESISGFSTTGASVITELEDPEQLARCVLFWRSFTHWLGGMGIIVLFVALLGHLGASGKALMRQEVPGPISESVKPRVRDTALTMWAIYMGISAVLTIVLMIEGMNFYDALCHCYGTMATGGFSTYNGSVGHFDSALIEGTIIFFMILAGTNFSLYYFILKPGPALSQKDSSTSIFKRMLMITRDTEYRTYWGIIAGVTLVLTINLWLNQKYDGIGTTIRHAMFMTVTILTTTGFGTEDFVQWSEFSKGLLLMLMFVGGCAGSTGGGMKVIRFVLFFKTIALEIERAFKPNVVRPLRIAGNKVDDSHRTDVLVYFSLILLIFVVSWMLLNAIEPNTQWEQEGHSQQEKIVDCASAVVSCLNNIGPGVGVLGPTKNYSNFSPQGKLLLTLLMLLGRLELFAILVLLFPSFWRSQ